MTNRMERQQIRQRLETVLASKHFSSRQCDIVVTIYTDTDCSYIRKNDFSVRIKRNPEAHVHDFIIHLYNHDVDIKFTRYGKLTKIVRYPQHNQYVEKCSCKLYKSLPLPKSPRFCFKATCNHGLACATKRRETVDLIVHQVDGLLSRFEREGQPVAHSNSQVTGHG